MCQEHCYAQMPPVDGALLSSEHSLLNISMFDMDSVTRHIVSTHDSGCSVEAKDKASSQLAG